MSRGQLQLSTWGHRRAVAAVIWEGVWQRKAYSWVLKAHRYEIWTLKHRFALQGDRVPTQDRRVILFGSKPTGWLFILFHLVKEGVLNGRVTATIMTKISISHL